MAGVLSHLAKRRRYATGGVGMSDPRIQIPERSPNALTEPATPSLAGPASGRTYHPLDNADYYTYGQKGGEHEFFTGSLPVAPLQPNNLPSGGGGGGGSSGGGGGAAGVLGNLVDLAGTAKTAGELANMAGYDNAYTDALKNPIKAGKDYYNYLGANNALEPVGSGQYANSALDQAGFGNKYQTPQLDVGTGLGAAGVGSALGSALGAGSAAPAGAVTITDLAGNTLVGSSGAVGAGEAGLAGGAEGAGAASSGLGATLASSGIATALPIAAIGWAIADAANKSGDIKSGATSSLIKSLTDSGYLKQLDPRTQTYRLSDGRTVRADEGARAVSEALRKGDRAAAEKAFQDWISGARPAGGHARGGSLETGTAGALHYATDPKFIGSVRGQGTGRSDEIPASLSDGEYVMDAETVALLGDGSTDAGARKLDEMRERLRAHKGKKLSRGKFSDNAKHPMEYLK